MSGRHAQSVDGMIPIVFFAVRWTPPRRAPSRCANSSTRRLTQERPWLIARHSVARQTEPASGARQTCAADWEEAARMSYGGRKLPPADSRARSRAGSRRRPRGPLDPDDQSAL
jgi:hypothetical protein